MAYDASESRDPSGKWSRGAGAHLARNRKRRARQKARRGPEQRAAEAQARRADRRHASRPVRSEAHADLRDEHRAARKDHAGAIRDDRAGMRKDHAREARSLARDHAREAAALDKRHAKELAKAKTPDALGKRHAAEKADLEHEHREARRALGREHRDARSEARTGHLDSIDALRDGHRAEANAGARDDLRARRGETKHSLTLADRPTPERLDRLGSQAQALGKTLGEDWRLTHGPARNASESREGKRAAKRGGFLVVKTVKPTRAEKVEGEARTHHLVGGERVATTATELGGSHVSIQQHAVVTTADNGAQIHGRRRVVTTHATHEEALAASRAHADSEAEHGTYRGAFATRDIRKFLSREHRGSHGNTGNRTHYRVVTSG